MTLFAGACFLGGFWVLWRFAAPELVAEEVFSVPVFFEGATLPLPEALTDDLFAEELFFATTFVASVSLRLTHRAR